MSGDQLNLDGNRTRRLTCFLMGHSVPLAEEVGCSIESVFAETGSITMSGRCVACAKVVSWKEPWP